ncbi:MAG: T9SS type A sorting domain-containing protein [Bacteroidales bacterium]
MKNFLSVSFFVFYTFFVNAQSVNFSFDSTMFIPDGPACLPNVYNASIDVNSFAMTDTIHNASDILSICVNIEHSFSGDLGFKIFCPNGQSMVLDANNHAGNSFLGIPYGEVNHGSYDNGCLPVNNIAGFGWNYCWSDLYPGNNMTLNQLGSSTSLGTVMVNGNITVDSTNVYNHLNYMKPDSSFASLIGCPLNGKWSMQITDDWAIDNGYIFGWSVELSQAFATPATPTITLIADTVFSDAPVGNQWYNLATGLIVGANQTTYHVLQTGYYFSIVTLNGHSSDTSNIVYFDNSGINESPNNIYNVKVTPNPFTNQAKIKYFISETSDVSLLILDISGKVLQHLVNEKQSKGEKDIVFSAANYQSGMYLYKLIINDSITVGKLLLKN